MYKETAAKWGEMVLMVFLSLLFIVMGGVTKLSGAQFQRDTFAHYGYPLWAMYLIGALELALGVLILFPRFRFMAACGMVLITIGVVMSVFKIGEFGLGLLVSPPVIVMLCAGMVALLCRPRNPSAVE